MTIVSTQTTMPIPADERGTSLGLLAAAIERGVPVEAIERLVALHREEQDRQAAREFARCLAEFQATCPPIPKSSKADIVTKSGSKFSYRYAELDQIAETVRPHLHRLGFSYSWDSSVESGTVTASCTLRHSNGHKEQAKFSAPMDAADRMSGPQKAAAALTYAKRQSLLQALGITTAEPDDDAMDRSEETITEEQHANLVALMEEVEADRPRFLAYLGLEDLRSLGARRYGAAVAALEQKRKRSQS